MSDIQLKLRRVGEAFDAIAASPVGLEPYRDGYGVVTREAVSEKRTVYEIA